MSTFPPKLSVISEESEISTIQRKKSIMIISNMAFTMHPYCQ